MSFDKHDFDMGTGLCGIDCRMLDDTYKLAKCVKIALLYLEVKFNIHISCDSTSLLLEFGQSLSDKHCRSR